MLATNNIQNVSGNSPDIYEGSYKDIFTHVNFNFSVFSTTNLKCEIGRPKFSEDVLFKALILKT
ncbi:MAG: hypothetical protein ACFFD2_24040 [Promethearchaeota archaeon]